MSEYATYFNDEYTHVYDLDDCLRAIKCRNKNNEDTIEYLRKENKRLKEENYKDDELQKMKQQLEKMKADYWRGFPISEDEEKAIEEWKKKHAAEKHGLKTDHDMLKAGGCIGGTWKYEFLPTSIGVSGSVTCRICGEKFEFQEIG